MKFHIGGLIQLDGQSIAKFRQSSFARELASEVPDLRTQLILTQQVNVKIGRRCGVMMKWVNPSSDLEIHSIDLISTMAESAPRVMAITLRDAAPKK